MVFSKVQVVPDVKGSCTRVHGGSGSAAALVAGVIALALNVRCVRNKFIMSFKHVGLQPHSLKCFFRPSLNWREIQHIIVWTSEISPLQQEPLIWKINGAGFYISDFFGFGMINAYNFVKMAKSMKHIPPMVSCSEAVYDYKR